MEVNGWTLYLHPLFQQQLEKLTAQVETLPAKAPELYPELYKEQPAAKLLATINRYIREIIPSDPKAAEFRQGNTLARTIVTGSRRNSTSATIFSIASPAKRK